MPQNGSKSIVFGSLLVVKVRSVYHPHGPQIGKCCFSFLPCVSTGQWLDSDCWGELLPCALGGADVTDGECRVSDPSKVRLSCFGPKSASALITRPLVF